MRTPPVRLLFIAAMLALTAALPGRTFAQEATPCVTTEEGDRCLPTAPDSARVDLETPTFSDPTNITNPLFPVSQQRSIILIGHVEADTLRIEVSLLPETKVIEWDGNSTETLVIQFVAYLNGRVHEVALDWYAQADDGSLWYLGEDVYNYEDGVVADTDGTWMAGRDGPPALIMPANPQVGDVFRPENMPGFVFEEVTVQTVGETVNGPRGPVEGAIIVQELHQDSAYEEKIFAPGYGEFRSRGQDDLEALALAVPTDALPGPAPAELQTLQSGAADIFAAAESGDWDTALATVEAMSAAWGSYRVNDVPDLLEYQMSDTFNLLAWYVDAQQPAETQQAAIAVERAALDLELQFSPPDDIDRARFDLTARQLLADAAAGDEAGVASDVTVQELIWDRIAPTFDAATADQITAQLDAMRTATDSGDLDTAAQAATEIRSLLAG